MAETDKAVICKIIHTGSSPVAAFGVALVAQRIELQFPKLLMPVRFLPRVQDRVVGQLAGRSHWNRDIVRVRLSPTLLNS